MQRGAASGTAAQRPVLGQLGLDQYETLLSGAGLQSTADLALVLSPGVGQGSFGEAKLSKFGWQWGSEHIHYR